MISQKVEITADVSKVVANFNGDIAVGLSHPENSEDRVSILFSNIEKSEVGKSVKQQECINTPIELRFKSVESAEVLKKVVDSAINVLKKKAEDAKEKKIPKFVVDINKIFVTSAFRNTNPNAEKIMKCQKYFAENGKLDKPIRVAESLTLLDEYTRYLVAMFNGVKYVEVVAPKGINIKVGDRLINFVSSELEASYGMKDGKFFLTIKNGGNTYDIPAMDNVEAVNLLRKITNVFDAFITVHPTSTLNVGLINAMRIGGVPVHVVEINKHK